MSGRRATALVRAERPIHEVVLGHAVTGPDAEAVASDGVSVSYREFAGRATSVAAALTAAGGVEGMPVAVRMEPGPTQAAAVLGVLSAGACVLCLDTGEVGRRGRAVLEDLRPVRLLFDGRAAEDELVGWYREALGGSILDVGVAAGPGSSPHGTACEAARAPLPGLAEADPDAWMYVTYTSGSTGRPKGIPQTRRGFTQFMSWFTEEFRIGPGARVAQWAAPGYDASLVEMFAPLLAGATLCPVSPRTRANPEKIVDWLAAERVTHLQTVPSFARQLLEVINRSEAAGRLPELDHLLLAGEPLTGDLANGLRAALPGTRLVNLYGPTESILATWHEVTGTVADRAPIGTPIPGREVLVLDELDRPCPVGTTGELVIHSPYITPGYVGAAAGERSAFEPPRGGGAAERFYRTGDLGRWNADGLLEFVGRRDLQVKFNGIRLELGDVEAVLTGHETVAECAVVAVPGRHRLVVSLAAFIVPRDSVSEGARAAWRTALRRWFGRAVPPVTFMTVGSLPRTPGGKVDRDRLRQLYA
ncbi:amino acid adenylation domain-containing protein [Sphaerimonospora cavernae]|uniref:Amino acid adenylation domain-containing protein n=1 Tax=Sphaerimonospora cavernae TaxID=1740611 RepID=A0ABV6U5Z7_9ACTN